MRTEAIAQSSTESGLPRCSTFEPQTYGLAAHAKHKDAGLICCPQNAARSSS